MLKPSRLFIREKSTSIFSAICYSTPILFQGFMMFYHQFVNANVELSLFQNNAMFVYKTYFSDSFKRIQFQSVYRLLLDMLKNFVIRWLFQG